MVGAHLAPAAGDKPSAEDREAMALGATLAGLAIAHCRTTVCHALGHAAGGIAGLVHGEVLAALTPAAFCYSMGSRPEKYRRIGGLLAGKGRADADGGDPRRCRPGAADRIPHHGERGVPDLLRVMFDPPGLWIDLWQVLLGCRDGPQGGIKQDSPGAACSLVDRDDEFCICHGKRPHLSVVSRD